MKSSSSLSVILFSLVLFSCSSSTQHKYDALELAQQDSGRRLAYQAEELQVQRQQLVQLQARNSELTEALFDLRQELESLKSGKKTDQPILASRARNKERSKDTASSAPLPQFDESGKVILGRAEWVWFDVLGRSVQARIDDKAKSSSIRADSMQLFERDGDQWVRFSLAGPESDGQEKPEVFYEAPLLRKVRVRPADADEAESRPVVRLKIKLGELIESTEFTLINRDSAAFPVVLGRSFLRDIAVVDDKRQYTQPPHSENSSL